MPHSAEHSPTQTIPPHELITGVPMLPEHRMLGPDERVHIDVDTPLADRREMYNKIGLDGKLVATVEADQKRFMIVDLRGTDSNRDFAIIDDSFPKDHSTGFKGIAVGETVTLGRDHHTDRFDYPGTVSRDHVEATYDASGLSLKNLQPTNGTTITAHLMQEARAAAAQPLYSELSFEDGKTRKGADRVRDHASFGEKDASAPYGYYMEHPIIGRESSSVDGGVYLGGSSREAIVVDAKSEVLKKVYTELLADVSKMFANDVTVHTSEVLKRVRDKVVEVMPYDGETTERISDEHAGDMLVGLSTYVSERAGVCRHQALLAASLVQGLIKDRYIMGSVGVERNTVPDKGGSHGWAAFKTRSNGKEIVIVIDPAQGFVGSKAQAKAEGRWLYALSTDEY